MTTSTDLRHWDEPATPCTWPTVVHRITAVTDVQFVEVSTAAPGWRDDVVRLSDRYGRTGTSTP